MPYTSKSWWFTPWTPSTDAHAWRSRAAVCVRKGTATFPEDWKVVDIAYILKCILEVIQGTTVNDLDVGIWLSWSWRVEGHKP